MRLGSSAVFRWRRQSCPDDEGRSCWLDRGDILVMDGQCQDEFLHCTDPGREQERINLTFRWVKQHASSCPLFRAGVACCLPTCVQGCSSPVNADCGVWVGIFWVLWFLLGVLCTWGVLALLSSLLCTGLGFFRKASCWTRPLGGGRLGHYIFNLWGEYFKIHKIACMLFEGFRVFLIWKLFMLALAGQPSLHGYDACMAFWTKGALRRNCGQNLCKTSFFSFFGFFC